MKNTISIKGSNIQANYLIMINHRDNTDIKECYIPAFDLLYSTKNEDEVKPVGRAMVKAFLDAHVNMGSKKEFFTKIHKLGFRTKQHDLVMKSVLSKGTIRNSKFTSGQRQVPEYFSAISTEVHDDVLTQH